MYARNDMAGSAAERHNQIFAVLRVAVDRNAK
jgi:hypothetical protein